MSVWTFNFTADKLAQCAKRNKDTAALFASLEAVLPKYQINTPERVAAFLAQCGHESVDFTVLRENLNYSAQGLASTWPNRFALKDEKGNILKPLKPSPLAESIQRKSEAIANSAYANRMGNGDAASGDGWKFRGRGAIQLTGKDNYVKFSKSINRSLDETVSYLETLDGAVESAAFFWHSNKLNELADKKDIVTLTKKINGGDLGLKERTEHFNENLKVLNS
jgi:putative chitinase